MYTMVKASLICVLCDLLRLGIRFCMLKQIGKVISLFLVWANLVSTFLKKLISSDLTPIKSMI